MTSNISAARIIGDTLYLDPKGAIHDPVLRRVADCVRELRPAVDRAIGRHGHGAALVALVAITADEAIDAGSASLIAEAFRDNAEMLDAHETVGASTGGMTTAAAKGEIRNATPPLQDPRSSRAHSCAGNANAASRPVLPLQQPGRGWAPVPATTASQKLSIVRAE